MRIRISDIVLRGRSKAYVDALMAAGAIVHDDTDPLENTAFLVIDDAAFGRIQKQFTTRTRLLIADIAAVASARPPGYIDALMASGERKGDWLEIGDAELQHIQNRFNIAGCCGE